MNVKKTLITGGVGFLGSHLCEKLQASPVPKTKRTERAVHLISKLEDGMKKRLS